MRTHWLAVSLLIGGITAAAQDTRTVTEPVVPPVCITLHADRTGVAEKLDPRYEKTIDTELIQSTLDYCRPGRAVELAPGVKGANAFLSGALTLGDGAVLLVDKGVTLYGSRDPKDYDPNSGDTKSKLLCGTLSDISRVYITAKEAAAGKKMPETPQGRTCKSLITVTGKNAAIMGDGTIDGRGGAQIIGHDYTWWQMARQAEPKQLAYYSTRIITGSHADGLTLYRIHLNNAPNCHVCVNHLDGFTAWGVHLLTPTVRGTDTRNTDGIDPGFATNVTVTKSWIDNGDDNIAIKSDVQHMSVTDNHFYSGHGMSIGSEVVNDSFILVDGLTEDRTTSGIRIKSNAARGGPAHDITFRNICMRGVPMPIAISPFYNNGTTEGFVDPGVVGNKIPDYKAIHLEKITSLTPGDVLIAGKDADHITEISLSSVIIKGVKPEQVHSQFSKITLGPGTVNFTPTGEGVTVEKIVDGKRLVPSHGCPTTAFPQMQ